MGFLEERYIWNNNPFFNIVMWKRYVDDVFCIFRGSKDLFNDFVNLLNNMIESIKFNVEINTHSRHFSRYESPFGIWKIIVNLVL